ncbi:MAG TPA: MBL fold metallo-hydrolase [Chloroflexia bacterium]|nr:MBL fold metallo-hydrolase [Chloroflexia bacterium]
MDRIEFHVLDVGQGQGNFIEIYEGGVLTHTILMDLGYSQKSKKAALASVQYIENELNSMIKPTIDLVILSHSDSDHISMVSNLLGRFTAPGQPPVVGKKKLTIGNAYYSGERRLYVKKRAGDVLGNIKKYFTDKKQEAQTFSVNYKTLSPKPMPPWQIVGDVGLHILIANTTIANRPFVNSRLSPPDPKETGRPDGYLVNTSSLVVLLRYEDVGILITGDATGITMQRCNDVLDVVSKDPVVGPWFKEIFMMTLPHHGSATSTFGMQGIKKQANLKSLAESNLTKFAKYINPACITASADLVRTFKHPSALVIGYFADATQNYDPFYEDPNLGDDLHFFTAYFLERDYRITTNNAKTRPWPSASAWFTVESEANIYSTIYFLANSQGDVAWPAAKPSFVKAYAGTPRAYGVSWKFEVHGSGKKSVNPSENRKLPLATVMPFPAIARPVPAQAIAHGGGRAGLPPMALSAPGHFAQPFIRPPAPRGGIPVGLRGLRAIP